MDVILNRLPLTEAERAEFLAAAPGVEQIFMPAAQLSNSKTDIAPEILNRITICLGSLPISTIAQCSQLKWLQTFSAGHSQYLAPGAFPEGAALTCAVGVHGVAVSEHVFACLLSLMKCLPLYRDNQHAHHWARADKVKGLRDSLVLLLGTGDLGGHIAQLVKPMGARTVGLNRHPENPVEGIDQLDHISQLEQWLPQADVVIMTLPESPETIHLMDARRLALLKQDAILINAGRGSAVDCMALTEVLQQNKLWGAVLDVTEPEPLPADHPLWDCPNLLLTPHAASGGHSAETLRRLAQLSLDNLKRYLAGQPLRNQVL